MDCSGRSLLFLSFLGLREKAECSPQGLFSAPDLERTSPSCPSSPPRSFSPSSPLAPSHSSNPGCPASMVSSCSLRLRWTCRCTRRRVRRGILRGSRLLFSHASRSGRSLTCAFLVSSRSQYRAALVILRFWKVIRAVHAIAHTLELHHQASTSPLPSFPHSLLPPRHPPTPTPLTQQPH